MRPWPGLTGSAALVVGGAGGIGAAILDALAGAGARPACVDLRAPGRPDVLTVEADVSRPDDAARAVERVAAELGGLDHVVYCAGITRDRVLWKLTDEDWSAVLGVNLTGAFHVLRAAVPHLRRSAERGPGPAVVLVSSINGARGKRGQANYAASKGGLDALGRTAARELGAFGVRVNGVAPGLIETDMTRSLPPEALEAARREALLGRAGRPEDVAHAVLFLLSGLAAHVTGQVLRVDGGQLVG